MQKYILIFSFIISNSIFSQSTERLLPSDSIQIDGIYRSFKFYVPNKIEDGASLVFFMHGSGGNPERARSGSNYEFENIAAQSKKHLIVYPLGYKNHWNDCRANASYKANTEDINEIGFYNGMINYFAEKYNINKASVFASGISNGGHMCFKLAYEMPETFKGIAAYVANIPHTSTNDCTPKNIAIPMMVINGTNDPINPNDGGWVVVAQDSSRGKVLSTEKTIAYWKSLLPCPPKKEVVKYEDINTNDHSTVEHYIYTCSATNIKVELVQVINGGHTVPLLGAPAIPKEYIKIIGERNTDINSPKIVMAFFDGL